MNNDHLEKINNEIIERRMTYKAIEDNFRRIDEALEADKHLLKVDKQFTAREIQHLKKMIAESPPPKIVVTDPLTRLNKESRERQTLRLELQAAARYIAENEVIHKKVKKDIPTVIEYQGRRYILDTKGR